MLNVVIVVIALALGGYLALSKRLAASSNWKATITPLASIMGSGFLVSAPLLAGLVGNLALPCTVLFHRGLGANVTAIISMTAPVAVVLPVLLSIAAIGSQFSAAVADNAAAGGLIEDITHRKVPMRYAYLLIVLVTMVLTWETNVNGIIAYASRAFALFYMLQCVVAFLVAWRLHDLSRRRLRLATFAGLAVMCLLVFVLGLPSE